MLTIPEGEAVVASPDQINTYMEHKPGADIRVVRHRNAKTYADRFIAWIYKRTDDDTEALMPPGYERSTTHQSTALPGPLQPMETHDMLRKNSKQYIENWEKYIADCIEPNEDNPPETLKDKLQYLADEFSRVANYPYNLQRFPNLTQRLADYLSGLPFSFDFVFCDVLKAAARLNAVEEIPDKFKTDICYNWFDICAEMILRIADRHGVKFQ